MTGFDWAAVLVVFISSLLAAAEGFFFELFFLGGSILGYVLAAWEYPRAAQWYSRFVSAPWVADAAGFLTIFFGVLLLAGIAGRLARWAFKTAGLQWYDRALGAVFGVVRGLVVVTIVVMSLAAFSPGSPMLAQSRFGQYFLAVGRAASWLAPSDLRNRYRQGLDRLKQFAQGQPPAAGTAASPADATAHH